MSIEGERWKTIEIIMIELVKLCDSTIQAWNTGERKQLEVEEDMHESCFGIECIRIDTEPQRWTVCIRSTVISPTPRLSYMSSVVSCRSFSLLSVSTTSSQAEIDSFVCAIAANIIPLLLSCMCESFWGITLVAWPICTRSHTS